MNNYHRQIEVLNNHLLWFGYARSITVAGVLAWFVTSTMFSVSWGFAGVWAGTIFGLCVGWAQKKLLEKYIPTHDWSRWILFSVAGGTIAWFVFMILIAIPPMLFHLIARSDPVFWQLFPMAILISAGAIFGLSQWLLLRRHFPRATLWILAQALGWVIGGVIGIIVASSIYDNVIPYNWKGSMLIGPAEGLWMLVSGTIGTIAFSAVTGIAFVGLLRQNT